MQRSYQIGLCLIGLLICTPTSAQTLPFDSDPENGEQSFLPETQFASFDEVPVENQPSELEERVMRLEAELNELRSRPPQDSYGNLERRLQNQDVGTGGLFGTIEVTFLRPHLSGAQPFLAAAGGANRFIDNNYQTGVRYQLGYKADSGLGVRGRYFSYDNSFSYVAPLAPGNFGIEMSVADFEVTLDQRLRHFDLDLSAGIRYGKQSYSNGTATLFNIIGVGSLTFEGVGPTASMGARRALGNSGLSLFGNVRGSVLVGDLRNGAVLWNMPAGTIQDEVMTVAENQMGLAYTRPLSNGMVLELRTAWESQYWMNSTLADDFYGIGSNLGMTGPTIAAELRY